MAQWFGNGPFRRYRIRVATAVALVTAIGLGCLWTTRPGAEVVSDRSLFTMDRADMLVANIGASVIGLAGNTITGVTYGSSDVVAMSDHTIAAGSPVTIASIGAATLVARFGFSNARGSAGLSADISFDSTRSLYGLSSGPTGDPGGFNLSTGGATVVGHPGSTGVGTVAGQSGSTGAGTVVGQSGLAALGGNGVASNSAGSRGRENLNARAVNGSKLNGATNPLHDLMSRSHDLMMIDTPAGAITTIRAVTVNNGIDATTFPAQAVPEPGALMLALTGVAGLLLGRRLTRRPSA
jgi:hypothetical protein